MGILFLQNGWDNFISNSRLRDSDYLNDILIPHGGTAVGNRYAPGVIVCGTAKSNRLTVRKKNPHILRPKHYLVKTTHCTSPTGCMTTS